ncbi:hypothetical protein CBM2634_A170033 [Cupriavidus taiwanensis]|uniref:Uncharacterized protein n=1 Tax=Cupriavidus taiwanensis TaxID=164546 RepID=A0A375J061_9BURK|nr:hypothetical protein CBM2634_A170033 [Cupriavidus taiwanensis]
MLRSGRGAMARRPQYRACGGRVAVAWRGSLTECGGKSEWRAVPLAPAEALRHKCKEAADAASLLVRARPELSSACAKRGR